MVVIRSIDRHTDVQIQTDDYLLVDSKRFHYYNYYTNGTFTNSIYTLQEKAAMQMLYKQYAGEYTGWPLDCHHPTLHIHEAGHSICLGRV